MSSGTPYYFNLILGVWVPGGLCLLGISGNLLSLLVLSLDRSQCPTFYSLRALATSDVILLLSAFIQQVVPMYYELMGCEEYLSFCRIQGYLRIYAWPVICIAQMASIWLTVLISAERYLAVVHPFMSVQIRSISKVRLAIMSIAIIAILYNIPRFFEFWPKQIFKEEWNMTMIEVADGPIRTNLLYRYLYNTALFCLLIYAIPLVVLIFLNVKIICAMRAANNSWASLNHRQQREVKATVMPLYIVVVFIVCCTQSLIAFILDAIFVGSSTQLTWLQIYVAITNLLVIMNSAVNFLIFYLFGRKFRMILRRMFHCQLKPHAQALSRWGWRTRPVK